MTAFAASPLASAVSSKVDSVTLTSATQASVKYDLTAAGATVANGQTGTAVLQDGTWKVGDDVFCGLLKEGASLMNITVPAACNSASLSQSGATAASGGRDRTKSVALAALCTLLFLTFLDNTIVSVGLGSPADGPSGVRRRPAVGGRRLRPRRSPSIMLACGMIGDELGRKKVMLTGAGVFCAGSVLCALAPNAQTLIAGRAIMGLGAAASEPGTLSVLRHIYTDDRARARAVGVWAAVAGLALALGPVVGGALVGAWSWRGIFWFNLFFGLAALLVAAITVPESSDPTAARVDTLGTLLGAGTLAALMFAIIDAETSSFASAEVIALLCASAVLAVAFVLLGAARLPSGARRQAVPAAAVHRAERRRLLHLPGDLRDLLLHRAVPGGGAERLRLPDRARLRADDGADDHRLGARGPLDRPGRARAGRSPSAAPRSPRDCCSPTR